MVFAFFYFSCYFSALSPDIPPPPGTSRPLSLHFPPTLPQRLRFKFLCCSLFVPFLSYCTCLCTIALRLDYTNFKTAYRAGHVPAVDPSQRFRDEYFVQRYVDKLGNAGCDSVEETERKRLIFHAGFVAGFGHD